MPQLKGRFTFHLDRFTSGLAIFALGMLLKAFFADGLAPLVDQLYLPKDHYAFADAWAASIGFGGQIYADFWGYSTMAVGLARMFGIEIPVNFRLPYLATSLREFWRRWHITLSQWLRDYVYKPLGGSHHGAKRTFVALMLTMLLGGLWHGANYTFIIWGAIHGVALALEHGVRAGAKPQQLRSWLFAKLLGWGYTFLVVFVAWVFFRAVDVAQAVQIVVAMFSPTEAVFPVVSTDVKQLAFLVALLAMTQVPLEWLLGQLRREQLGSAASVVIAFCSLSGAVVLGAPVAVPFIYFQF
jgi:D-alanyl-lipoteichoic acid acyltransferase DltB (MBOAT superfamily)